MAVAKKTTSKGLGKGLGRGINALIPEDVNEENVVVRGSC